MKKTLEQLQHAMQSGVALEQGADGQTQEQRNKHLRVGVNSALIESSVLVRLLIEKGVFTLEEFNEALRAGMEREVADYEARLSMSMNGVDIKLA